MKACIYARTSRLEKRHTTTKIEHQVAFCLDLSRRFNLTVEPEHVFTDVEMPGDLPPTCWAPENEPSRPALSALIAAIEERQVSRILVRRLEKLGTTSLVLDGLRDLLASCGARIMVSRELAEDPSDPTARYAMSTLQPYIEFDLVEDQDRRARLRAKKLEELERLRAKVARLEGEIAEL
ncbi:MAG: recombinase family protein [Lentisphaerae bacterium]|nr:recombinase family protein [Lentisphaerota bacterium]